MIVIGILLWVLLLPVLVVLWAIGLVAVFLGLVADGKYNTPPMWEFWGRSEDIPQWWFKRCGSDSRWTRWKWMAIRNPISGMKRLFTQPCAAFHPNPDDSVRKTFKPASLWTRCGIYWEYWYMRKVGDEFLEFRIGWRFGDTRENFSPTLQLRKGP